MGFDGGKASLLEALEGKSVLLNLVLLTLRFLSVRLLEVLLLVQELFLTLLVELPHLGQVVVGAAVALDVNPH